MLDPSTYTIEHLRPPPPDSTLGSSEAQSTPRRLQTITIGEFVTLKLPPREMVLAPILPVRGLAMLFASRGVGKTYVALGAAYAVSCGIKFLRWHAPAARRVLYVDGEMPQIALQERLQALMETSGVRPPTEDHFRLLSMDRQPLGTSLNLAKAEHQSVLQSHLDGVDLLVLDNLSTLVNGGRENDAESWDAMQGWQDASYVLHDAAVVIGAEDQRYFERLESVGVTLTLAQKRWWVKKAETLGGDMKREYPATPDEAFEQALEGAYFAQDLFAAAKQGRVGGFPYDPRASVQTFWDLGRNDLNTIWLHQHVDGFDRFIGYYENSGEFIGHYVAWLKEWAAERRASFGDHYVPHDGDRESLWLEGGTKEVMRGLGFHPRVVARPRNKLEAIGAARTAFAKCQFDEQGCGLGLKRLRAYRKEWDEERGVWKDRPRHDDASHGADAFLTFACSGWQPPSLHRVPKRDFSWVV